MHLPHVSSMSKILVQKTPQIKLPTQTQKMSTRVLTSAENLKLLEEKQKKKEEELRLKEERKMERERKRKEKAEKKNRE